LANANLSSRHGNATRPRVDIYVHIHKALRALMADTQVRVGSVDGEDGDALRDALAPLRTPAAFCGSHLDHENRHVHAPMKARQPGSAAMIVEKHRHHEAALRQFEAPARAVAETHGNARTTALAALYRHLAVFVGENLIHMHTGETEHNAVLSATHGDEELIAIEQAIVASLAPEEAAFSMRWMLLSMNPAERVQKLAGIDRHAPWPVCERLLGIAREALSQRGFDKLAAALNAPERIAA
jgi:hypothetical protein